MTMTIATIQTFADKDALDQVASNSAFVQERDQKVSQMLSQGKTDGALVTVSPLLFKRNWLDQDAVDEWVHWIDERFVYYGFPPLEWTFEPISQ